MRKREQALGDANLIGLRVQQKRKELSMRQNVLLQKLQAFGIDMNASGLSKLEGQLRKASDVELVALSKALDVSVLWLLGLE